MLLALLKASLVLGIVQLLVLRPMSAAMKHLLLTIGIGAFVVMPLLALFAPAWRVEVETEQPRAEITVPIPSGGQAILPVQRERQNETETEGQAGLPVLHIWALGTLAVLARLLRSAHRVRAIARNAQTPSPRLLALLDDPRVRLLKSSQIRVPMVWGIRSGTLLLPEVAEEWTEEELRATFIHELGHLQRLDYLSLALMNLVSALLWFHPQVWIARRQALAAGERACDDLVLRAGGRASGYASHLLHVARLMPRRDPLAALLAMSRPSQLEGRMLAILSPSTNRHPLGGKRLMISIATFIALVVPFAVLQISAEPPAVPPVPPAPHAAMAAPVPPAPVAAIAAAVPPAPAAPGAPPAPVTPAVEYGVEPEPPEEPMEPSAGEPEPPLPPVPGVEAIPAQPPVPGEEPRPAAPPAPPAPAAPAAPPVPAIRAWSQTEIGSRDYRLLCKLEAHACTLRLLRPTNTGDPNRNPAETRAMNRLLQDAAGLGANAVTNVKCYREIGIGLSCPTTVTCEGDAIALN
jgi:beta-lactamase regulating signal transducer with metallopeptidase domain